MQNTFKAILDNKIKGNLIMTGLLPSLPVRRELLTHLQPEQGFVSTTIINLFPVNPCELVGPQRFAQPTCSHCLHPHCQL